MRLRFVQTCHFGKSELTNFLAVLAKHPEFANAASPHRLKRSDVVLLVSKLGNQLVFVHGFDVLWHTKKEWKVLRSVRFRISGGAHWNPLMLADYAKSVDIELTGLASYEEHVKKLLKE
jgi:hypothetical protein